MRTVFISYSHGDADFADKLVSDLHLFDVEATYDKLVLNVGDSIIGKLAEHISAAASVVALLSPRSVESTWVRKELALAMVEEIASAKVKVLPAVIEDCRVPDMLLDKLYADFRTDYYRGLQAILQALQSGQEGQGARMARRLHRKRDIEASKLAFSQLLEFGEEEKVRAWLHANTFALAGLFGRLWNTFEVLSTLPVGDGGIDFTIVNGQSGRFDVSLIYLGPLNWDAHAARQAVALQEETLRWCRQNTGAFRRLLAVRMESSSGARQIASRMEERLEIDAKIITGRREQYGALENSLRNNIYRGNSRDIDIISYDRIIDVLGRLVDRA